LIRKLEFDKEILADQEAAEEYERRMSGEPE
jgi:hypothetical protein